MTLLGLGLGLGLKMGWCPACPEGLGNSTWSHHLWKSSKNEQMWDFVMWFSGHGDIQSKVGLGGLGGLFQGLSEVSQLPDVKSSLC